MWDSLLYPYTYYLLYESFVYLTFFKFEIHFRSYFSNLQTKHLNNIQSKQDSQTRLANKTCKQDSQNTLNRIMSSSTQYQRFCASVLEEFRLFCGKGESPIDPGLIQALITEYTESLHTREALPVSSPPVKKGKRGGKKASVEEACDFCRMPVPDPDTCMARTHAKGLGTQCGSKPKEGEYCKTHHKQSVANECGLPTFGRIEHPRHLVKHDGKGECGWKHYKAGEDGVEDIVAEAVGVGPIPEAAPAPAPVEVVETPVPVKAAKAVETPVPEKAVETPAPAKAVETPAPAKVVETPAPVKAVETPALAEPEKQLPTPEAVKDVVKDMVETIHNDQEGDTDEDVNLSPDAPGPTVAKPVEEVSAAPESQDTEDMEEEDLKIPAICMGVYQGVTYRFVVKEGEEHRIVQMVDPLTCTPMDVGHYDGEEIVFEEEYLEVHESKVTNEGQEDVIWM
jgi:hypothetical protein